MNEMLGALLSAGWRVELIGNSGQIEARLTRGDLVFEGRDIDIEHALYEATTKLLRRHP